jgi:hypothetical protein
MAELSTKHAPHHFCPKLPNKESVENKVLHREELQEDDDLYRKNEELHRRQLELKRRQNA